MKHKTHIARAFKEKTRMKAAVYERYGPAEVLRLTDIDVPAVRPDEDARLLVEVPRSACILLLVATEFVVPPYQGAMEVVKYAVLDVETTSGDPRIGRIMEVAVIALDGSEERMRWDSLVDPRMAIPPFAQRLTGIQNSDIRNAPRFHGIVNSLDTLTQGRVVVAHNVRYDMTAIEHEFARTGLPFQRTTLCTERTTRRLLPGLSHYNLGSLCRYFGIPFKASHRALVDAEATAQLLIQLLVEFGVNEVISGTTIWCPVHDPVTVQA
jgi:DNA polymerase III epsilon subunit-like protein